MSEPLKPSVLIQNRRGRVFKVNGTTLFYSLREAIQKAREIVQDDDHRILYGESNTFHTLDQMEAELQTIFDRDIDLITRQGIETSRNYLRRHEILSSAQVIYATGSSIPA